LSARLQSLFPQLPPGPLLPHPVQGCKSRIFGLGSDWIVKLRAYPAGQSPQSFRHGYEIERDVLEMLTQRGIACPAPVATASTWWEGEWVGLAVLGRIQGVLQADTLTDQATSLEVYARLGDTLRTLNQPWDGDVLKLEADGFRQWVDYSQKELEGLSFFCDPERRALRAGLGPLFEEGLLEAAAARPVVIHNDPQAYNVMLEVPSGRLVLLDWEAALLGPWEYQWATALTFIAHPGFPLPRPHLEQRQQALGVDPSPLILAFRLQRLLGALQREYEQVPYAPGQYLQAEHESGPILTRERYEQQIRWQCEAELRRLLQPG
jgi:aminoglycoside phosphotransferase (APT) family kinase protein